MTTGLKCAPDTAPNIKMSPMSAPAVAAAFSKSCRPTSSGDSRLAMMPDPTTAMIKRHVPSASATRRRARSGLGVAADGPLMPQPRDRRSRCGFADASRPPPRRRSDGVRRRPGSGTDQWSQLSPSAISSWARSHTVTTNSGSAPTSSMVRGAASAMSDLPAAPLAIAPGCTRRRRAAGARTDGDRHHWSATDGSCRRTRGSRCGGRPGSTPAPPTDAARWGPGPTGRARRRSSVVPDHRARRVVPPSCPRFVPRSDRSD